MSYSTALRVMSSIFDDDEEDEDEEELVEDDDDDELPPPLEPFAQVQASSTQADSPSSLPLTRSYMTSVSTNQDPEPRPIVVNDPDDLGGVAVTTTVHVHHDEAEELSNATDGEEGPYALGGAGTSSMRTASGTDLSSLLRYRSTEVEIIPNHPPRPRSALSSYATDHHDSFGPSAVGSQIAVPQQQTISISPPPLAPALRSPPIGSTTSPSPNVHNDDDGERSDAPHHPLIDASAPAATSTTTTSPTPYVVTSHFVPVPPAANTNPATTPSSSSSSPSPAVIRKESKRERSKSERERRSFVTDGRGRVVALAETDPDAEPSLFWTQPSTVPGDESGATVNLSELGAAVAVDAGYQC